jgi:3,8-divinyl chlorophyllide a/chlorophyllide a reductase subunit Y
VAGAGSLAQVVNAAIGNKNRFDVMKDFFEGVGHGDTSGIHLDVPTARPEFRKKNLAKLAAMQGAMNQSLEKPIGSTV